MKMVKVRFVIPHPAVPKKTCGDRGADAVKCRIEKGDLVTFCFADRRVQDWPDSSRSMRCPAQTASTRKPPRIRYMEGSGVVACFKTLRKSEDCKCNAKATQMRFTGV